MEELPHLRAHPGNGRVRQLREGPQRVPNGLPIKISDKGDFLGLLPNGCLSQAMDFVIRRARNFVPRLSVMGYNLKLGLEKYFPVLSRSDQRSVLAMEDSGCDVN